jgi:hypothetical protein
MPSDNSNFGGFSPIRQSLHIRFRTEQEWAHFARLWKMEPGANVLAGLSAEDRFRHICIGTVLEHELRHFHDNLLAPTSTSLLSSRLTLLANSLQLLSVVRKTQEFDVIPVPLQKWLFMATEERERIIAEAHSWPVYRGLTFWRPPVLSPSSEMQPPRPTSNILSAANAEDQVYWLCQIARSARNIKILRDGFMAPGKRLRLSPRFVHEASALVTQVFSVWRTYGAPETAEFLYWLSSRPTPFSEFFIKWLVIAAGGSPEDTVREDFEISRVEQIDFRFLSAAFCWCLLGHPLQEDDNLDGCPAVRANMLFSEIVRNRTAVYPDKNSSTGSLFGLWDHHFHVRPWKDSLQLSKRRLDSRIRHFGDQAVMGEKLFAAAGEDIGFVSGLTRTHQAFQFQRNAFLDRFCSAPEAYVQPNLYLWKQSAWGECPSVLDFSKAEFGLDAAQLPPYPVARFLGRRILSRVLHTELRFTTHLSSGQVAAKSW